MLIYCSSCEKELKGKYHTIETEVNIHHICTSCLKKARNRLKTRKYLTPEEHGLYVKLDSLLTIN